MVDFWRNYDNLRKMSKVSLKCRIRGYYVVRVLSLDGTELIFVLSYVIVKEEVCAWMS